MTDIEAIRNLIAHAHRVAQTNTPTYSGTEWEQAKTDLVHHIGSIVSLEQWDSILEQIGVTAS